jgi:lipopolysaccharide/colanic/teichoic acid biosynthesis glycosyltransferase
MWGLKTDRRRIDRIHPMAVDGILNEQTFWQIVRTERERADRSGVPVTVAIFTVRQEQSNGEVASGWSAASLCSVLRSTARVTDHVGIAGENELGVILWGTRELGAYRFVNRVGTRADRVTSACRLFVYPSLSAQEVTATDEGDSDETSRTTTQRSSTDHVNEMEASSSGCTILNRISDVEEKLAEALQVETPSVVEDDCVLLNDSFGFGADETQAAELQAQSDATLPASSITTDSQTATLNRPSSVGPSSRAADATDQPLPVQVESLDSLFMHRHPRWKRCLDIGGAAVGLVILSPVLAALTGLIKVTSPGPVLFRQTREGHGGHLFTINKFRTMRIGADAEKATLRANSEQDGPAFKMQDDPRITPIGRFLRKTCLDELPQLWNVLIGDMTLVGPRPLDVRESTRIARWGRRRLLVKPGLTCIWQVHGKSKVSFNEWMRMDIRYAQKISLWHDLKLMLATLRQMILRQASH